MSSPAITSSYGNSQPSRQSDVYTPDDMELFEKVYSTGGGRGTTQKAGENREGTNRTAPADQKHQDAQEEDDDEGGWEKGCEGLPSHMLWTCDICRLRMSIFSRIEHIAHEHMPKDEKRTRESKKKTKAELSNPNTQMWHCELCDKEVSVFFAAEHTAGRNHILKLKQRGDYRYTPASAEVIEHRAVYKPQDGEGALAEAYDDDEEEEDEEEEESAVYRPDKLGGKGHGGWVADGKAGGRKRLQESAAYELEEEEEEEEEDEDWESGDVTTYPPPAHKPQHPKLGRPQKLKAAPPLVAPYPVQTPAGVWYPGQPPGTEHMYPEKTPAGIQHQMQSPPGMQHPGQPPPGTQYQGQPPAALQHQTKPPPSSQYQWQPPMGTQYQMQPPPGTQYPGQPPAALQYLLQSPAGIQYLMQQLAGMQYQMQSPAGSQYQWQPPVGMQYPMQSPVGVQYPMQPPAGTQYPGQPPPPPGPTAAGDQVQEPASPHTAAVHTQVPTFYCDLCDTEYPTSEQNEHPEETMECITCDDVYHANQYAAHLASRDHIETEKAQNYTVTSAVSKVEPPAPPSPPSPPPPPSPQPPPPAAPKPPAFHCQICDRTMGEDSRQSHLAGIKHRTQQQEFTAVKERLRWASRRRFESALRATPTKPNVNTWQSHVAGRGREEDVEAKAPGAWQVVGSAAGRGSGFVPRRWSQTPGAGHPGQFMQYNVAMFYCKPCGIRMHINSKEAHLGGAKHSEAVTGNRPQGAPASQNSDAGSSSGGGGGPSAPLVAAADPPQPMQHTFEMFHCEPCGISMHINNKETHLSGIRHSETVIGNRPQGAPASQSSDAGSSSGGDGGPSAPLVAAADPPQPMQYTLEMFHCEPCGITMHINNKETHLSGIKHSEAVAGNGPQGAPASQNSGAGSSSGGGGTRAVTSPPSPNYHCTVCNLVMPLIEYQNHKYGKRHRGNELAHASKQGVIAAPAVPALPRSGPSKSGAAGQAPARNYPPGW